MRACGAPLAFPASAEARPRGIPTGGVPQACHRRSAHGFARRRKIGRYIYCRFAYMATACLESLSNAHAKTAQAIALTSVPFGAGSTALMPRVALYVLSYTQDPSKLQNGALSSFVETALKLLMNLTYTQEAADVVVRCRGIEEVATVLLRLTTTSPASTTSTVASGVLTAPPPSCGWHWRCPSLRCLCWPRRTGIHVALRVCQPGASTRSAPCLLQAKVCLLHKTRPWIWQQKSLPMVQKPARCSAARPSCSTPSTPCRRCVHWSTWPRRMPGWLIAWRACATTQHNTGLIVMPLHPVNRRQQSDRRRHRRAGAPTQTPPFPAPLQLSHSRGP